MTRVFVVIAFLTTVGADSLRIEKTGAVGRKIENQYFVADLSHRTVRGAKEESGTLRALTYKSFGVTLLRTQNRMHWAPNWSRVGNQGYRGIGTWDPVQTFREEQTVNEYIHYREGYLADSPEMKIEAEYRFLPGVPYFLFWSRLTVERPMTVRLLRNNEMTMDDFFTHVTWPSTDGTPVIKTFDERYSLLEQNPIGADAPWVAFLNLEKGYGYGYVTLESRAAKTVNATLGISDGANNGKYWARRLISQAEMPLAVGDQFEERTAYVLFRCSASEPLEEFFRWEREIRQRFGSKPQVNSP